MIISENLVGKRVRYVSSHDGAMLFRGKVIALGVTRGNFAAIIRCDRRPADDTRAYDLAEGELHSYLIGFDESGHLELEDVT